MYQCRMTSVIILVLVNLSFLLIIKAEILPACETLKDVQGDEDGLSVKLRRVRALCEGIEAARERDEQEDPESIPDFNLNQLDSENDANQILKRFRRARFSSSRSGSSSSSSSRSSSSSSRSSSSSSGSRFFGGSRSSSSSSSSGGSSRIFSRGSSSSSSASSSSGSRGGIFSRGGTSSSSSHRVRDTIRSVIRKPTSSGSGSSGLPGTGSGSGGLSGTGGSKPGLRDKIRKITHGSGGGSRFGTGGSSSGGFGTGGFSSGGFGTGSSSGSGGNVWVRAGKKFLPVAVRFGKRYYQRRKYNKGMYAAAGAGAGYYAGSRMDSHNNHYYPHNNYGSPPETDYPPEQIDGQTPTVFYCLQQDLNATLVNKTLDDEGFGVCNVSGTLLTCPIEIECKTSEADNCCEDEQGTPYCCGGPIPTEYMSQYGGYGDDWDDATDSLNKLLNIITAICLMMATICFTVWQQQE